MEIAILLLVFYAGLLPLDALCKSELCFCQVLCWEIVWRNIKEEVLFGSIILYQELLH